MNMITVVTVANKNAEPTIVYEVNFNDGIRTANEAAEKAIEYAKSLGSSYLFIAVGETHDNRSQRLRALDVMTGSVWLNGSITALGSEWFK